MTPITGEMGMEGRCAGAEDMIERVALAITGSGVTSKTSRRRAMRAIEAMRVPTVSMLAAALPIMDEPTDADKRLSASAFSIISPHHDYRIADAIAAGSDLVRDWRNMIDAALSPTQRSSNHPEGGK